MTSDFCVAVHALVFLHHKGCSQSSEEMAANICTQMCIRDSAYSALGVEDCLVKLDPFGCPSALVSRRSLTRRIAGIIATPRL